MTKESRDYLELAYRSIECFANDGTLKPDELKKLVDIALRDGVVDDNERRILRSIFAKLSPQELTPDMRKAIEAVREQAGI